MNRSSGNQRDQVEALIGEAMKVVARCVERLPEGLDFLKKQADFAQSIGRMVIARFEGDSKVEDPDDSEAPATFAESADAGTSADWDPNDPQQATEQATATEQADQATATEQADQATASEQAADEAPPGPAELPDPASLSAKDAIALVADADTAQLAAFRTAEVEGKNRVTVLRAVDARLA